MKRQRNTTHIKEQTRNTEVQINEEEIGKKRIQNNESNQMIKNLENKMEKMQESILKEPEELKNKHTETNNTIIEIKILWKESIADCQKQKNESVSWKIKWWK